MTILMLAHFLQAIGLSLMMGASSSWMFSWCVDEQQENKNYINYLGHLENEIQSIGGIISGVLGAILSFIFQENGYVYVFLITSTLMIPLFFKLMCIPKVQTKKQKEVNIFSFTKFSLKNNFCDKKIILFFAATALITALYQPVFHFWQPFFKDFGVSQAINDNVLLGLCFALFSLTKYFFNSYIRLKIIKDKKIKIFKLSIILTMMLFCIFLTLAIPFKSFILCCFLFCLLHGSLSIVSKIINDQYLKDSHELNVAIPLAFEEALHLR